MKRVIIDFHHSQVPEPPDDIVAKAQSDFLLPSPKMARMALKSWYLVCQANNWDGETPGYVTHYAIFMNGFLAGHNLRVAEERDIAASN